MQAVRFVVRQLLAESTNQEQCTLAGSTLEGPSLNSGDWRVIEDAVSTITNMS